MSSIIRLYQNLIYYKHNLLNYFINFQDKLITQKLVKKEFVIISELTSLVDLKNKNLNKDIEIGEEKKYYTLIGYPININRTVTRDALLFMLVILYF